MTTTIIKVKELELMDGTCGGQFWPVSLMAVFFQRCLRCNSITATQRSCTATRTTWALPSSSGGVCPGWTEVENSALFCIGPWWIAKTNLWGIQRQDAEYITWGHEVFFPNVNKFKWKRTSETWPVPLRFSKAWTLHWGRAVHRWLGPSGVRAMTFMDEIWWDIFSSLLSILCNFVLFFLYHSMSCNVILSHFVSFHVMKWLEMARRHDVKWHYFWNDLTWHTKWYGDTE